MTSPQTGDRVVYFSGEKWASYRIGGQRTLWRAWSVCWSSRFRPMNWRRPVVGLFEVLVGVA